MRNNFTFQASPGSYLLHTTATTWSISQFVATEKTQFLTMLCQKASLKGLLGPLAIGHSQKKRKQAMKRHLCAINRSGKKQLYFHSRKYFGGHLEMLSEYIQSVLSTSECLIKYNIKTDL